MNAGEWQTIKESVDAEAITLCIIEFLSSLGGQTFAIEDIIALQEARKEGKEVDKTVLKPHQLGLVTIMKQLLLVLKEES